MWWITIGIFTLKPSGDLTRRESLRKWEMSIIETATQSFSCLTCQLPAFQYILHTFRRHASQEKICTTFAESEDLNQKNYDCCESQMQHFRSHHSEHLIKIPFIFFSGKLERRLVSPNLSSFCSPEETFSFKVLRFLRENALKNNMKLIEGRN